MIFLATKDIGRCQEDVKKPWATLKRCCGILGNIKKPLKDVNKHFFFSKFFLFGVKASLGGSTRKVTP